jgi:hypothetical protein
VLLACTLYETLPFPAPACGSVESPASVLTHGLLPVLTDDFCNHPRRNSYGF